MAETAAAVAEVDKHKGAAVGVSDNGTRLGASTAASTSGSATAEAGLALLSRYVESVSRSAVVYLHLNPKP